MVVMNGGDEWLKLVMNLDLAWRKHAKRWKTNGFSEKDPLK